MRDQMKKALRMSVVSLVLCTVCVSSLARADDCRDALSAESCACQSAVRSEREQPSASDKSSLGKKESKARNGVKTRIARSARPGSGSNDNSPVGK